MWGRLPTFFCYRQNLRRSVNLTLEDIVVQELDALGLDLFDLRRAGSRARPIVEVRIDRRDGGTVTIDDCARASRAIERRIAGHNGPWLRTAASNRADFDRLFRRWAQATANGLVELKALSPVDVNGERLAR